LSAARSGRRVRATGAIRGTSRVGRTSSIEERRWPSSWTAASGTVAHDTSDYRRLEPHSGGRRFDGTKQRGQGYSLNLAPHGKSSSSTNVTSKARLTIVQ